VSIPSYAASKRPFCSAVSGLIGEPLAATASRVDHWILVEYGGAWARDPLAGSELADAVKQHLRAQLASLRNARLLFVKQPVRGESAGTRVLLAASRTERLLALELDEPEDLAGLDLAGAVAGETELPGAEALDGVLFAVCTHGKRDRCCALHGRPLYDALREEADGARVWQSTHVGGDRFAGNVVVLPYGLYYGRVLPADVPRLVEATAGRRIELGRYRGRSTWSFPVQAAERALREATGLVGIDDLALAGASRTGDGTWEVRFRTADGAVHELDVAESAAEEATYLTCESEAPRHPPRWAASVRGPVSP
jgi:hypothetical protein